jgi:hypothetical protein
VLQKEKAYVHKESTLYESKFDLCLVACLVGFKKVKTFSAMMLDGKMFYFTFAATIRQLLEVLLLLVKKTLK